jgi:antitoxin YefM
METSYTKARENLAALMDKAVDDREAIIIHRRGQPDVALIAADELESLIETLHVLGNPANAESFFRAMEQSSAGLAQRVDIDELRAEFGLPPVLPATG